MNNQDENPDHPHVHSIREENQKCCQSVMEQIFIVASFRLDEGMAKETPNVFAELNIIVNLHSKGGILEIAVVSETVNRASAPEERRKKG